MKKICITVVLALMSGLLISCNQAPPPQNAFRLKTRVKFRLFGVIPLFAVPAPFQQINLKTSITPSTPNTTGTKSEFNPNGAYVTTDRVGKFDALDAVLPANWTVKINPNQPIEYPCTYPATMSFSAQGGQTYKYRCSIDLVNSFDSTPESIYVNSSGMPDVGGNPINWGTKTHSNDRDAVFSNANNLTVEYYRLTGIDRTNGDDEAIFELESTRGPKSVNADGTELTMHFPSGWHSPSGFLLGNTTKMYHIVLKEDNIYIGHSEFHVDYPEQNCPQRTRVCD